MSWLLQTANKSQAALVQQTHCRPNWSSSQWFILKCYALVDTVDTKAQLSLVHVEKNPEDTFLFELMAVFSAFRIGAVSQLTHSVEPKAKIIIAKRIAHTELLLQSDTNFKLVLCSWVCHNLPVVLPVHKRSVSQYCSEQIIRLNQKRMSVVLAEMNLFRRMARVPAKFVWLQIQQLQPRLHEFYLGRFGLCWFEIRLCLLSLNDLAIGLRPLALILQFHAHCGLLHRVKRSLFSNLLLRCFESLLQVSL